MASVFADDTVLEAADSVLWDVVEEHLDEAEFCCDSFERLLEHPMLTLHEIRTGIESRLVAHVDALVIGDEPVVERLLVPAIIEGTPSTFGRVTAATLALLRGDRYARVTQGLQHDDIHVREATLRGCLLARTKPIEAWAFEKLRGQPEPFLRAILLPLVVDHIEPALLLECLQVDDPKLLLAAVRAASREEPRMFLPVIEYLLEHTEPRVRESAIVAGLSWGSHRAWDALQREVAVGETACAQDMLALWAVLSDPAQHAALAKLSALDSQRSAALFAIGFSGNPALVSLLIEHLRDANPAVCKIAAQSFSLITGLDLNSDEYTAPAPPPAAAESEGQDGLPPLEDDDLAASLVPPPEDELPVPNAEAIAHYWHNNSGQFDERKRYLRGAPLTLESVFEALDKAPMRVRHVLALMLGVRTAGQCWLDTRAFTFEQRERLGALRSVQVRGFARQFGHA